MNLLIKGGNIPAGDIAPSVFYAKGSDCGGADQTKNRTLSVSGVSAGEMIFIQRSFQYIGDDYTKATVAGVTQYTFLNKIYNQFILRIYYWM